MRKLHLILIAITSLLLLASVLFGGIQLYAAQNTVPSGTIVGGLELGGQSIEEAERLLDEELQTLGGGSVQFSLQLTEKKTYSYTWSELGVSWTAPEFRTALLSLSSGSLWDRTIARKNFLKHWSLSINFNPSKLKNVFSPAWESKQFGDPVNATRTIDPDDRIHYLPGHAVQRIRWAAFIALIREAAPDQFMLDDEHSYSSESRIIKIPLILQQPAATIEGLKKEGITRKIAEYSTNLSGSAAGRIHNVDAAARSIDGMILPPDGIFDYASIVEAAETNYGFREAPVILSGKLVPGVGGGICQVSSTLYNAAIRAGLKIVERKNHSLPVSYVPKGQDATFATGYINFRFQNTSKAHLLITAQVEGGQLTIKLFGDSPENTSYDIESITTDVLPVQNKYVANPSLPSGSQEIILEGKPGYIVETYQIKKVNGKVSQRLRLSRDTYPAQPTVIAVHGSSQDNSSPDSPKNPSPQKIILEDGVAGPTFGALE